MMPYTIKHLALKATAFVAFVAFVGCEGPGDATGIYIVCDSNQQNWYWTWSASSCVKNGQTYTRCPQLVHAQNITNCYERDEWLADTDTGGAADAVGIDRDQWPTDPASETYIRNKCTDDCQYNNVDSTGEVPRCDPASWVITDAKGHMGQSIKDPGKLDCQPWRGKPRSGSLPETTPVVPITGGLWPSDQEPVHLECDNYRDCADQFETNIIRFVALANPNALPADDASEAEYLVTASLTSGSSVLLATGNNGTPSEDSHAVQGRLEYTAARCGLDTCPFYLANLRLANSADTWALWSDSYGADVVVADIDARLRRPMLGVWRPDTGEVYLAAEMLDFEVSADISIGNWGPLRVTRLTTNARDIFGQVLPGGAITLDGIAVADKDLYAEANGRWGDVVGAPPRANFSVASHVSVPPGHAGYPLAGLGESSRDPDGDISHVLWFVDGVLAPERYEIPPGRHMLRLEVFDGRGASDSVERLVTVDVAGVQ